MTKVDSITADRTFQTITFVWMQGERDARESHGSVYKASMNGLMEQLKVDLDQDRIFGVIGRLSDFDLANERYPHWTLVRDAQVSWADSSPDYAWIDTDDLNDGFNRQGNEISNDLHMSEGGYVKMGERFAAEAIKRIERR